MQERPLLTSHKIIYFGLLLHSRHDRKWCVLCVDVLRSMKEIKCFVNLYLFMKQQQLLRKKVCHR